MRIPLVIVWIAAVLAADFTFGQLKQPPDAKNDATHSPPATYFCTEVIGFNQTGDMIAQVGNVGDDVDAGPKLTVLNQHFSDCKGHNTVKGARFAAEQFIAFYGGDAVQHDSTATPVLQLVPLDDSRPLTRIALGSCAKQNQPQPIWNAVAKATPDLFIFLGDNIYGDSEDMRVLKRKYAQLAAFEGFQRLTKTCPILATWDDHDYGADDAGEEYPMKVESQQIFLDFFGEPADSRRRQTPGVYDARIIGPPGQRVQIILLDTRYFRGPLKLKPRKPGEKRGDRYLPNPDTSVTLLGETQWKWLEEQLKQPAELRIVASSNQVINEDHDSEHWSQLPHERKRLFNLIRETKAAGLFFISGDVHRGELSTMDGGVGYPLFDLTSSGLNRGHPEWRFDRPNRHRIGTMQWGNNFGMIVLEWDRKDPRIRFQIIDEEGDIAIQRKINLSTLQPGVIP